LIQDGQICQFYTDHETAKKLGTNSTGNGFRPSLSSAPQPGLVNLIIQPGTASFEQLLTELDNGLVVDQILGGGADISGDFSINVDLGYRVENGQITGRVKDTMVSGNVYELLNQIQVIGGDAGGTAGVPRRWQGSCATPSILLDEVSITA
jgi:PmbA protein